MQMVIFGAPQVTALVGGTALLLQAPAQGRKISCKRRVLPHLHFAAYGLQQKTRKPTESHPGYKALYLAEQ